MKSEETKFAATRAFSQGDGVWLYWQMEVENENQGFFVYRVDSRGEKRVSEFKLGAGFRYADAVVGGQEYTFFDEVGAPDSVYRIEALSAKRIVKSDSVAVEAEAVIPKGADSNMFVSPAVSEAQIRPTSTDLALPLDLRSEVLQSSLTADPAKHKEVVALPGVRIKAKDSGLIRVTRTELQNAGFNVNGDSSRWQLYLEGVELPLVIGANANYIEFIGKALDTAESDTRTYYLTEGATDGKRIRTATFRPTFGTIQATKFEQRYIKKERTSYISLIQNGPAENYWGRLITSTGTDFPFTLKGIDQTPGDRVLKIAFRGLSLFQHSVSLSLNGNVLTPATGSLREAFEATYSVPVTYLKEGGNILSMKTPATPPDCPTTNPCDIAMFDYLSIDFGRKYVAENDRLDFYTQTSKRTTLSGFTTQNVRLFDVTSETDPVEYSGSQIVQTNGTFGPAIPAGRARLFYATESGKFSSAVEVSANNPEMLGVPTNAATFVIISHQSLLPEAQTWANYRAGQGIQTKVVNVEDIFDEFSYGVKNAQAIKSFLYYAKNNWQTPPAYVLLIGDASYDPKNYEGFNGNLVPTMMVNTLFEETGSDEALADFANNGLAELAIGRISSRTGAGVTTVFNKTVTWEASLTPNILDRGALFAYDQPIGYDFGGMAERIMAKLPATMPKTTVARPSPDSAAATTAVINAFNSGGDNTSPGGKYIANYTGHGTAAAWAGTGFFWRGNFGSLTNSSSPSLVTALTCLNAYFVMSDTTDSFAEAITKAPNGGAVAIWASTGKTTPDIQEVMALRFYEKIGEGSIPRIGDLIRDAKAQLIAGPDVRLSWTLIGDPMLKVR